MDYHQIIQDYAKRGKRPPMCLISILLNDLYGAVTLCPPGVDLHSVVGLVQKYVPTEARGSIHSVEEWIGEKI